MARERGFLSSSTLEWLSTYRFSGSIDGYRDGRALLPGIARPYRRGVVRRSAHPRDDPAVRPEPRRDHRVSGRPHGRGGPGPPVDRRGQSTHPRRSCGRRRLGRGNRRVHGHLQPRGGPPVRPADGRHHDAHVHPRPPRRGSPRSRPRWLRSGTDTTLLVDTFDIEQGIRHAIEVAGPRLGAVRLDSGDPLVESGRARTLLDDLGAAQTRILISGDLDEYRIAALADSPVDAYMVGTKLVTGSGAPAGELVYKLVAVADHAGTRCGAPICGEALDGAS